MINPVKWTFKMTGTPDPPEEQTTQETPKTETPKESTESSVQAFVPAESDKDDGETIIIQRNYKLSNNDKQSKQ